MTRHYATSEMVADGIVHVAGIAASITAVALLIFYAVQGQPAMTIAAISIYGAVMIASFTISGIYNLWPFQRLREGLRRADHAAIFLKVAGTYTPLVVLLGSMLGYVLLGIIWVVAIGAAAGKIVIAQWSKRVSLSIYLAMGWGATLLIFPMLKTFPTPTLILIATGGGLYTIGTIFYTWEQLKFQVAIWHLFVLIASACFFAAIAVAL